MEPRGGAVRISPNWKAEAFGEIVYWDPLALASDLQAERSRSARKTRLASQAMNRLPGLEYVMCSDPMKGDSMGVGARLRVDPLPEGGAREPSPELSLNAPLQPES
jgi:hypothetical protein